MLVLGGTAEARELAGLLLERGFDPMTSLAGVTTAPILPPGRIRKGGFGGAREMARFLVENEILAVADATHPYAVKISQNAFEASLTSGVPYLRLERPEWMAKPDDLWQPADDVSHAARLLPVGARALVTTGRKDIEPFLALTDVSGLIRLIEPVPLTLPGNWKFLLDRPPYTLARERLLMEEERVTIVVTKNAGGHATRAKLDAAREKKIPVIIVMRPLKPEAKKFWPADSLADHLEKSLIA